MFSAPAGIVLMEHPNELGKQNSQNISDLMFLRPNSTQPTHLWTFLKFPVSKTIVPNW